MATINIISSSTSTSGWPLNITSLIIQISGSDYALIQSNPNALNFVYGGVIYNVNGTLYGTATVPPYGTLWQLSTSGGNYYVSFLVNPSNFYFTVAWTSLNFPYDLPPEDPNYITITQETDDITPVYNPVTFKIFSPKYNETGYRYLVDIKGINDSLIGRLKVVPLPDGSGYVDIQKILSNYVTKNFDYNSFATNNCTNSYFKYKVEFGEEYLTDWEYTNVTKYINPSSQWNGYSILNQANSGLTHNYIVGDQITIDTVTSGLTATINGLHDVVAVPATNQIVIDAIYPSTGSTIPVSGSTIYSDSRKTGYSNLSSTGTKMVWNGVLSWNDWKNYDSQDYNITGLTGNYEMLTNIKPHLSGSTIQERYFITKEQDYYINYMVDDSLSATQFYLYVSDNLGNDHLQVINPFTGYGNIRQFKINYDSLISWGLSPSMTYADFKLSNNSEVFYSKNYRLYIDNRCLINETEIYFMDKLGSILSIPFQLKQSESIDVERETFNQQKYYDNRTGLDLTNGGDTIHHMSSKKTYTLNTNWMNDRQMELFEIMMESPYTWIKLDNILYNCIIEDKSTEIEKYKNKALFRKNIKVYLSLQDPLNI